MDPSARLGVAFGLSLLWADKHFGGIAMSLSEAERVCVSVFVSEEEKHRRHLLVALGDSRAYGYSSPSSDTDSYVSTEIIDISPSGDWPRSSRCVCRSSNL